MIKEMTSFSIGANIVVAAILIGILPESVDDMMSTLGIGNLQTKITKVIQNHLISQDNCQMLALILIIEIEKATTIGQGIGTKM